jgi:hypothetical protein
MTAYDQGYNAFKNGIPVRDNPFSRGESDWQDWDEGWFDAKNSASSESQEFTIDKKEADTSE